MRSTLAFGEIRLCSLCYDRFYDLSATVIASSEQGEQGALGLLHCVAAGSGGGGAVLEQRVTRRIARSRSPTPVHCALSRERERERERDMTLITR